MSILNDIELEIRSIISGFTVVGGFYSDWGTVQPSAFDHTRISSFPAATVELMSEDNLDEFGAVNAGMFINDIPVDVDIFVKVDLDTLPDNANPIDYIDAEIFNAIEDIKRGFGTAPGSCLEGKAFVVLYKGFTKHFTSNFEDPAYIKVKLMVRYRQDRGDPGVLT